jgi:type VI secretion system secreted protein VgrG
MNSSESIFGRVDEVHAKLRIDGQPDDAFVVLSFQGTEKVSKAFSYRVTVASSQETAAGLDDALGRDVLFTFQRSGDDASVHYVHGMVDEVRPSGVAAGKTQRHTQFRIVPRLSELRHKQRCQVFQDMTVVEIAKELTSAWSIELEARLSPEPLKRAFCTQVNERDFDFLLRILSEEGIHFHIEQSDQKAILVLVNDSLGYQPIAGKQAIAYRDAGGALAMDHIRTIVRASRVRAGSVVYGDYNFLRPTRDMLARQENAKPNEMGSLSAREIYEYPGRHNAIDGENVGVSSDVQGQTQSGKARAKLRLEEQRSGALKFSGTTNCLRMAVGKQFEINDHPDSAFNRKYTITSFEVRGEGAHAPALEQGVTSSGMGVSISFAAVAADSPIRPKVRAKPPAHLRLARVVGPKQDEPYVDEYGRIKIQFAWDREGKNDEHSSCWVRMGTPLAHQGQGSYTAHRVGAEVMVDFLDGDVDRPVVIGALFHEDNRQPQKLPDDATRAVLYRGLSVPGNKGKNEISCEDRAGQEEIFLHAQKDLNERILHSHSETIGASQSTSVGGVQSVNVGGAQSVTVGGIRSVTVTGNEEIHIKSKRTETVDTGEAVTVTGGRGHTVATGDDALTVSAGNRTVTVSAAHNSTSNTVNVAAATSLTLHHGGDTKGANGDAILTLMQDNASLAADSSVVIHGTKGNINIFGGQMVSILAGSVINLTCGAASLELKSDGTITANGSTISIAGSKEACLKSGENTTFKADPSKASVNSAEIDVTAVGTTVVGGALIKIG